MSDPVASKPNPLSELRAIFTFLGSLWGIVAGLSVLFPASNALIEAIPTELFQAGPGVYTNVRPSLLTASATMTSFFILLFTIAERRKFLGYRRSYFTSTSRLSFILGSGALVAYLVTYTLLLNDAVRQDNPLVPIAALIFYAAFFGSMTRAFVILGLGEYLPLGDRWS